MVNYTKGITFCTLWYFSIWTGFLFVCCPLFLFILIYPKLFLRVMSIAFSVWEMYPVALMNVIFGTKVYISGDRINANETSIILLNHRTRIDWNFLWAAMYYGCDPRSHRLKIISKAEVRHTPSLGWVMQVAGFLYIRRKWDRDEITMRDHLRFYKDLGHTFQILIFPEGTNLTEKTLERSNKFAEENNLEKYTEVLHPKTRGFQFLAQTMRENQQLDSVYDLTLAYPDHIPEAEKDVVNGIFPSEVHFHIKRYDAREIPENEEALKLWINKRWKEKEDMLKKFYKNKTFSSKCDIFSADNPAYLAFFFWSTLQAIMFYWLFTSTLFFWWTIVHSVLFIILSLCSDGFQHLAVLLHNRLKCGIKME